MQPGYRFASHEHGPRRSMSAPIPINFTSGSRLRLLPRSWTQVLVLESRFCHCVVWVSVMLHMNHYGLAPEMMSASSDDAEHRVASILGSWLAVVLPFQCIHLLEFRFGSLCCIANMAGQQCCTCDQLYKLPPEPYNMVR